MENDKEKIKEALRIVNKSIGDWKIKSKIGKESKKSQKNDMNDNEKIN